MTFPVISPVAAPAVPLDQHASHYFASHFIMLPGQHNKNRRGHLDYLVPFLHTETDPNSPFQLAYSACGLAALSNREKSASTDLNAVSYMQHTRAMRAISSALQDPVRCKTDATLAAVQLLCFFEVREAMSEGMVVLKLSWMGTVLKCLDAENHGDSGDRSDRLAHP